MPSIYGVGDAIEVADAVTGGPALVPLAGPASRQGRAAADHLFGRGGRRSPVLGTAIVRVFGTVAATTGPGEKALRAAGIPHHAVHLHPNNHAGYYPGARPLHLKLLFAPDGRVLGAQATGGDGVDKRIDVIATAIRAGLTVDDLADLELAYSPPFGSAKDPVNLAGMAASNLLTGDLALWRASDLLHPDPQAVLLDVRSAAEFGPGHLPGALNIPHTELRQRLGEIPRDRPLLVYCASGLPVLPRAPAAAAKRLARRPLPVRRAVHTAAGTPRPGTRPGRAGGRTDRDRPAGKAMWRARTRAAPSELGFYLLCGSVLFRLAHPARWSGCSVGWRSSPAATPRRTSRSWCCVMRSRSYVVRSAGRSRTGPTALSIGALTRLLPNACSRHRIGRGPPSRYRQIQSLYRIRALLRVSRPYGMAAACS